MRIRRTGDLSATATIRTPPCGASLRAIKGHASGLTGSPAARWRRPRTARGAQPLELRAAGSGDAGPASARHAGGSTGTALQNRDIETASCRQTSERGRYVAGLVASTLPPTLRPEGWSGMMERAEWVANKIPLDSAEAPGWKRGSSHRRRRLGIAQSGRAVPAGVGRGGPRSGSRDGARRHGGPQRPGALSPPVRGTTRFGASSARSCRGHPRRCGERGPTEVLRRASRGLSRPERGTWRGRSEPAHWRRVIPGCAGNAPGQQRRGREWCGGASNRRLAAVQARLTGQAPASVDQAPDATRPRRVGCGRRW